ncbi:MAG TPA: glycosyltransferase family 39 protein [Rhizomicrobium sp.]|jgi:4-amino-4-deoxy-L-arabinose transferase-like glycosyltransferase|nr:glycosyltransferase family 39 protein [Rhizomicrobium sp.]
MTRARASFVAVIIIVLMRLVAAAVLPLSADEAYYWLWSKHLAFGYHDHPPMIAYAIRAGLFDDEFGVRFTSWLLSVIASWAVWRAGAILLKSEYAGALACVLFNLTPMVAIEGMVATPDAPALAASALFLLALAKIEQTNDGRWWLAAGIATGFGLLSKYTMFFAGAGAMLWLILDARARRWWFTPWPYAAALIAFILFAPNLWWNATHRWETFALQFGRVGEGQFTLRYIFELLGAQLGLATPFIFLLGAIGLFARKNESVLPKALIWPALVYFVFHALHDRVQGNWPSFLYPAFAILAAQTATMHRSGRIAGLCRSAAIPFAAICLAALYAQAIFNVVPLGRADPFERLMGFGVRQMGDEINPRALTNHILTADYETAAWVDFYAPHAAVIDLGEDERWKDWPQAKAADLAQPMFYLASPKRDLHALIAQHFAKVEFCGDVPRLRENVVIERYKLYCVSEPKDVAGRVL